MVARDKGDATRRQTGLAATLSHLMKTWSLFLGSTGERAAQATRQMSEPLREAIAATRAVLRSGTKSVSDTRGVVLTGMTAALIGAILSMALAAWQGAMLDVADDLIIVTVWLCVRVAVMLVLDNRRTDESRLAIVASWATGLLPFAIAVLPVLRVVAWAASLWLSYRVLRLSTTRDEASALMKKVVGFELGAIVLIWLARNLTVAAVLLGS